MPSNKPKVQAILTNQYHKKLIKIAEKEGRSISQMTARIIEKYIDEYEKKNGSISMDIHHNETVNINNN